MVSVCACTASSSLNSTVNSQQLFSSIVNAIKDVSAEVKSSTSQRPSIKDIRAGGKNAAAAEDSTSATTNQSQKVAVGSSRQIPMHARLEASNSKQSAAASSMNQTATKTRSKFAKRFNMTGSGMTQADSSGLAANSDKKKERS